MPSTLGPGPLDLPRPVTSFMARISLATQALLLSGPRPRYVYYNTKGRQVAWLWLVVIQPSVDGSRHVPAGPTV